MMTMDGQGTHQRGQRHIDHLPLADIQGAPRNAKRHNGAGLAASLGKFGVGEPPLLDERTGRLVAGHGRIDQLRRMQQAGQTPPDGVTLDADGAWLVPVTRGWASRSDLEAEAYLVASNQLTTAGMLRATERGKRVHPTQKPVALAEWAFSIVDPKAERRIVLDVFGGSGSTLIAAHTTERTALVAELEPAYVDVMVKRWVELTGLDAVRENDGRPWSELAAP